MTPEQIFEQLNNINREMSNVTTTCQNFLDPEEYQYLIETSWDKYVQAWHELYNALCVRVAQPDGKIAAD